MKNGSIFRCNYYRLSSLVVMLVMGIFIYWAMFSSPKVSGQTQYTRYRDSKRNAFGTGNRGNGENKVNIQDKLLDNVDNAGSRTRLQEKLDNGQRYSTKQLSQQQNRQQLPSGHEQQTLTDFEGRPADRPADRPASMVKSSNFGEAPIQDYTNSNTLETKTDKWIVLTTIQGPTDDVKFLSSIEGWKVVVVGDTKTPKNWSYPNCVYLSVKNQKELGYETVPLLPFKSYGRKNVGYLYAIAHGAKIIYETDDDNRPTDYLKHFIYDEQTTGLKFVGGNVFNPYRHFGQPTLWPRGYPMGFIADNVTDNYQVGLFKTPSIQQGVVNGDPDMGAMFRLTRKRTNEMLNVSFDAHAPPALLPPGVLAPFNSQNTLFLQDALWALLIPTSVTFRVCDIWRGYWAQRLLWEIGGTLGFFAPNAFQKRNSHSYVKDSMEEEDLYFKGHNLFDFLLDWKCESSLSFFDCAIKLSEDMCAHNFWNESDLALTKAWFKDLKKIGYTEPKRLADFSLLKPKQPTSILYLATENGSTRPEETPLSFTAGEMYPPMFYNSKYIVSIYWNRVQNVLNFCNSSSYQVSHGSLEQHVNHDVILVVVFKQPNYDTIPFLNLLYSSKFSHIVYCGSNFSLYENISNSFNEVFTFVEADVQHGWFSYRCVSKVLKMKYRAKGVMMIGSQTLLNTWVLDSMTQRDRIWFDHSILLTPISQSATEMKTWPAWTSIYGKTAFTNAWLHISQKSQSNPLLASSFEKDFKRKLIQNSDMTDGLFVGPSDVVFIPSTYADMFLLYIDIFSKYNVLHEIVIPTVISGLDLKQNMVPLNGRYMWSSQEEANYEQKFDQNSAFLHPLNVGEKMRSARGKSFICNIYLPFVIGETTLRKPTRQQQRLGQSTN